MFDLNQIRCFVTVAEELHFGRAAHRLGMTQPPLSRQIQVLERIIDAQLLERTSRSVHLTPAGRNFLPEAKRILKLAFGAAEVARRISAGKIGFLKLGFTAGAAYDFLPKLLGACRLRLPDVDFTLKEMVTADQLEALASGQIDAALLRPPVTRPDLLSRRVLAEQLVAAIPADHRLAGAETVAVADFDREAFVMYAPYEARYFHDLLMSHFARADIAPRFVQHLHQIHAILAMVRAGLGCAIVPAAATSLRFADVRFLPLRLAAPASVDLMLTWRRFDDDPLLLALIDIARSIAAVDDDQS